MARFVLLGSLLAGISMAFPRPVGAQPPERITARLGISAGEAGADLPLGTTGPTLAQALPILFESAARLGVEIETASVGQGFYTADGELLSERDLDLVVHGAREDIAAQAAVLGRAWDQGSVFVWYAGVGGSMAAAIPLPGGAELLTPEIYRALVAELSGGGHVRYAGPDSLIFVANIGDEPEVAFFARLERVRRLVEPVGLRPGPLEPDRLEFEVVERAHYDEYLDRPGLGRGGWESPSAPTGAPARLGPRVLAPLLG
jgi:hypothetical protein